MSNQEEQARRVSLVDYLEGVTLGRRELLRRSVVLGIGGLAGSVLLAACGGDDDDDDDSSGDEESTTAEETETEAESEATESAEETEAAETEEATSEETEASSEATETEDEAGAEGTEAAGSHAEPASELADEQVAILSSSEPIGLDPGVSYGYGLSQFRNLWEGLVDIDPRDNQVVPNLAESYEANEDATAYTFKLRDGLMWSDGTPITSEDFVYSWKRVLMPETASQYIPALYPIKGVQAAVEEGGSIDDIGLEAVDDATLEVTLEGATPYFPLLATIWTFYPVPKHVIDEAGAEWYEAGNLVTTGPFQLTEWNHNQNMVLEPNPNYWGEAPTITRLEYTLFDDEVAQSLVAYENDELDFAIVPSNDVERVRGSDMADQIITIENSRTRFVVCDCTNAPTDDVRVRQALSMALNRETLTNQVRQGHAAPAYTVLPKDIPGYNPDASLGEDVEKAKALLAEAGFEDPSTMEISLVYISTQDYKLDAEYVQSAWTENLGIKVTLEPIEENTYSDWRASRETQPFNTYIGQWGSDFQDPFNWHNQNFTSQSDHYRNHWKNDEFDQLVAEAAVNPDEDARFEQYKEAEVILVHDAPIIPLHHALTFYVAKPYLKGVYLPVVLTVVYGKYLEIEAH